MTGAAIISLIGWVLFGVSSGMGAMRRARIAKLEMQLHLTREAAELATSGLGEAIKLIASMRADVGVPIQLTHFMEQRKKGPRS